MELIRNVLECNVMLLHPYFFSDTEFKQNSEFPLALLMQFLPYTGCHRRKGPNFGKVLLMLNYTDITQNTYIQS